MLVLLVGYEYAGDGSRVFDVVVLGEGGLARAPQRYDQRHDGHDGHYCDKDDVAFLHFCFLYLLRLTSTMTPPAAASSTKGQTMLMTW